MKQNPPALNQNLNDAPAESNSDAAQIAIEAQPESVSFVDRMRAAAESALQGENNDAPGYDETSDRPKRDRSGYVRPNIRNEISTLVTAVLTLVIAALSMPPEIKPDDDETNGIGHYAARIIVRHFPMTGKLSADALDIIGLIAVFSGYYARVSPVLAQRNPKPNAPAFANHAAPSMSTPAEVITAGGGITDDLGVATFLEYASRNNGNGHH